MVQIIQGFGEPSPFRRSIGYLFSKNGFEFARPHNKTTALQASIKQLFNFILNLI